MVPDISSPLDPLHHQLLATGAPSWDAIFQARDYTRHRLAELAGGEFTPGSDIDWYLLHDGAADPQHFSLAADTGVAVNRLRQLHVSEVNSHSRHNRLSRLTIAAFREVAALIPDAIPLVIESIISPADIPAELRRVRAALPAAGETPEPHLAAGEWVPV